MWWNSIKKSNLSTNTSNYDSLEEPIAFDIYSVVHMFFGFFCFIILHIYFKLTIFKSFILSNLLHLLYELKDFYFSYIIVYKGKRPHPETDNIFNIAYHSNNSYINSIFNQLSCCFGFLIAFIILK